MKKIIYSCFAFPSYLCSAMAPKAIPAPEIKSRIAFYWQPGFLKF